jgi:hypothetical protein
VSVAAAEGLYGIEQKVLQMRQARAAACGKSIRGEGKRLARYSFFVDPTTLRSWRRDCPWQSSQIATKLAEFRQRCASPSDRLVA